MELFTDTMKALSDVKRVKILKLLQVRPLCVCEIQSLLDIQQPSASKHLRILEKSGFVACQKVGLWMEYKLSEGDASPFVAAMLGNLRHWLEDDPTVKALKKGALTVSRDKICKK